MCVVRDDESFHDLIDIGSGGVRVRLPAAYEHDWSSRYVDTMDMAAPTRKRFARYRITIARAHTHAFTRKKDLVVDRVGFREQDAADYSSALARCQREEWVSTEPSS